jgi:hypothetical protein
MSKTAEEIGMIVGGIAIAGLGFGLGEAGLIAMQGAHAVLFNAMLGIGLTTTLSGVGLAFRQIPSVGAPNKLALTDGVSPRRVIYGQFQTAGVLTYASFPPSQNQTTSPQGTQEFLHLVYTLTGHQISSFDAVIIDGTVYNFGTDIFQDSTQPDTPWQIHPGQNGTPNDFYWEHMLFEFDTGKRNAQPFPNLAYVDKSWTSAFLQRGCAKVHVICRYDTQWTALYPSGQIPNIQFLVTGKKLIDPRISTASGWVASAPYPEWSYLVDNKGIIWFQSTVGSPDSGASRPNFESHDTAGSTLTDGGITWYCTGIAMTTALNSIGTGPPTLSLLYPGEGSYALSSNGPTGVLMGDGWQASATYSQPANQYLIEAPIGYLQLMTANSGATGSTRPVFQTIRGDSVTDGGVTWTCLGRSWHAINPSNSALAVYDYLQDTDAGMGVPESEIDSSSVIAAANVCEESELIIWNSDGTQVYENLYSCNGMFDHSSTRGNVLTSLCASMAGWVVQPGDYWRVFAGGYYSPNLALGDDDLRGPLKGDFRLSRREVANGIKGRYIPAYLPTNPGGAQSMTQVPGTWQAQPFPPYQANGLAGKPNYLNTEDGGQIIWQDLQLDFTTSLWTAQRLAKITLMRLRFQETLALSCKLSALQLEPGDTFTFTHSHWGLGPANVFEATEVSIAFESGKGKDPAPTIGIDIIARSIDPSIYDFTAPSSSTDYGEYSPFGVTGVMTGVE